MHTGLFTIGIPVRSGRRGVGRETSPNKLVRGNLSA